MILHAWNILEKGPAMFYFFLLSSFLHLNEFIKEEPSFQVLT